MAEGKLRVEAFQIFYLLARCSMPTQVKSMSCAVAAALVSFSMLSVAQAKDDGAAARKGERLEEIVVTGRHAAEASHERRGATRRDSASAPGETP
jgi:hypothetical protein